MLNYKIKRFIKDILGWDLEGRLSRSSWLSHRTSSYIQNQNILDNLVVSLTTIPSRINRVHVTIESILNQTMRPKRVVLWLTAKNFSELNRLPPPLLRQKKRGLEIYHCETDWPHQKLLPSLAKWPNSTIITADDDIIYPVDWIHDLYRIHKKIPDSIVCRRARIMGIDEFGLLTKYDTWPLNGEQLVYPSHSIFPTGVDGALYPPNVLHSDVFDLGQAERLCPRADDIWFKIMAFRNGTKCVATSTGQNELPGLERSQIISLCKDNLFGGGNDRQLSVVLKNYDIKAKSFFEII